MDKIAAVAIRTIQGCIAALIERSSNFLGVQRGPRIGWCQHEDPRVVAFAEMALGDRG